MGHSPEAEPPEGTVLPRMDSLLLSKSADLESFLEHNLTNIIFYSSEIEGNKTAKPAGVSLIENGIVTREGAFEDYIDLINHRKLYEGLIDISKKSVDVNDVLRIQALLFGNLLGRHIGTRRYRVGVDDWVSSEHETVGADLKKVTSLLNKKPGNPTEGFEQALRWHLGFVGLHPFEDGNGRMARLFMNLCLLKSGIEPLIISKEMLPLYFDTIQAYRKSEYEAPFFIFLLANKMKASGHGLPEMSSGKSDEEQLEFKTLYAYSINRGTKGLEKEIEKLYSGKNTNSKLAALWMFGASNTWNGIISGALKDGNERVRAMAAWSAGRAGSKENEVRLREMALKDDSKPIRCIALYGAGRNSWLDGSTIEKVASETDEDLLTALCWTLASFKAIDAKKQLEKLVQHASADVRTRAYQALLARNLGKDEVMGVVGRIGDEDEAVAYGLMRSLYGTMLNEPSVADELVGIAAQNSYVSDVLLTRLVREEKPSETYLRFLEGGFEDEKNVERKAYVSYLLGRAYGSDHLASKFGLKVSEGNSELENLAIFLSHVDSNEEKSAGKFFTVASPGLNSVESIELHKLLTKGSFSKAFLLRYRTEFVRWN